MVAEAQRRPHVTPSQVVVVPLPIGPSGHGMQRVPHVAVEKLETHWPLQGCEPALQRMPHEVPSQVAVPPTGEGQAVQLVPHEATDVSGTQFDPH